MKSIYRLFVMLIIAAQLLSACGTSSTAQSAMTQEPAAQATTAPEATSTTAESAEKVKVVMWSESVLEANRAMLQKEFVDTFNAAHPNIQLELQFQEKLDEVERTALQAGSGPDIVITPGPAFALEYKNAGFIQDLSKYAEKYAWKDKVTNWAYDSGSIEGSLYSLPLSYETMVLYYNKKVFAENGWQPPTSRADIEKLCDEATQAGLNCFTNSNQWWKGVNEWLLSAVYNNYAGADNVYAALQGKKPWTDPEFAASTQILKDWMDKGWFSGGRDNYFAYNYDDVWNNLCGTADGTKAPTAIMNIEGTWAFQRATPFCKDDWDWVEIPALREGVKPGYVLAVGSTVAINAKSENPDAAAEVLDWMVNDTSRAAKIIEGFNFGEWNVPLHYKASDFSASADPRLTRYVESFAAATGTGNFGYTTWTFWPAKTDAYIISELDSVFTGDLTVEAYQQGQQDAFQAELTAGSVPPAPATKSVSK